MPDRSHLKKWLSTYKVGNDPSPVTYIFTSLGCPYECSFCSIWPQHDRKYYMRGVESVVEELKSLDDYEFVRFADANTVVDVRFIDRFLTGSSKKASRRNTSWTSVPIRRQNTPD